MPRSLHVRYPGAIHHRLSRGEHLEPASRGDTDHRLSMGSASHVSHLTSGIRSDELP